jgi:protein-arginine kinase activator protein McsA
MSKESVPIGLLCSECAKFRGCIALCSYARQYVNQDYVAQHDALFSDKGIILPTIQEDFTSCITTHDDSTVLLCKRCGHTWKARIRNVLMCPKCKNTK